MTVHHRAPLSYGLPPLSWSACRQVQWLPGHRCRPSATSISSPQQLSPPISKLSKVRMLPQALLLSASLVAAQDLNLCKYITLNVALSLDILNQNSAISGSYDCDKDLYPGNESLTSPTVATTMSTLGNQNSLTSQRFFAILFFPTTY